MFAPFVERALVARANVLVAQAREHLLPKLPLTNHELHVHWSSFLPALSSLLQVSSLYNNCCAAPA